MRKMLLALFVLFFLSFPALAFSDNLSTSWGASYSSGTTTPTGWNIVSGTWDTDSGFAKFSGSGGAMYHTIESAKHIEYVFRAVTMTFGDNQVCWSKTSGNVCSRGLDQNDTGSNTIKGVGFTYTSPQWFTGNWYKVNVDINVGGNQATIKIYNLSNSGSLFDSQTVAYTDSADLNALFISCGNCNTPSGYWGVSTSSVPGGASGVNSISWNKDSYVIGDIPSFSWVIADSSWAEWTNFYIDVTKDGSPYAINTLGGCISGLSTNTLCLGSQTGTFSFGVTGSGAYKVALRKGILNSVAIEIASATVRVFPASSAFLTVGNNYIPIHTFWDFNYSYGIGGITLPRIESWYTDPTSGKPVIEGITQISPQKVPSGSIPIQFNLPDMVYSLKLYDRGGDKYYGSPLQIHTFFVQPPITQNISTSSITLDRAAYFYGETMTANWRVDNDNFTSPNQTYLDIFNWGSNIITGETWQDDGYWRSASGSGIGSGQASSNYWILVQNSALDVAQRYWKTGNNAIRLMRYNRTDGTKTVIAYANFTLSGTNLAGYGLQVNPNPVVLGNQVTINATIPSGITTASVTILDGDGKATIWSPNWKLSSNNTYLTWTPKTAGNYIIGLFSDANMSSATLQIQVNLVVRVSATTPTPTVTPTVTGGGSWGTTDKTSSGYVGGIVDGWVSLLGLGINNAARFSFALMITFIFLIGGLIVGHKASMGANGGLYAMFLPLTYFTYLSFLQDGIEYFPKFFVIIIILIIALKTKLFT